MFGKRSQIAIRLALCAGLVLAMLIASQPAAANSAAARDVLSTRKGLVEQRGTWVLPLELEMRRELAALPKLRQELQKSRLTTDETFRIIAQRNAAARVELEQSSARLATRLAQDPSNLGAGQRKILSEQISRDRELLAQWQQAWVDPAQLGGLAPLRRQLIKLTNCRNELAISLLKIHEQRQVVTEQYAHLAEDRDARAALAELGDGQRLGPLDDYHAKSFLAKLADYERDVFTGELPLYRAGGELRVAGLIGRTPVTFTWRESSEPTMLTASVIEAAGLEVPQNAPQVLRRLSDGREITVREFEVPEIRFGNQLLRGVKAYALPPEAENAGTQIGPSAFEGLTPKAQPQNLRLVLD